VAEAVSGVLVPEVDKGEGAQLVGEVVQRVDESVVAGAGGVVPSAGAYRGDPERPFVRGGDDLRVAAVVPVFPGPTTALPSDPHEP
jgi:hypothetical protein